ncbi:uncharacterized protein RSE6_04763 [Rhynchosporium secalis]|uniref:Amidase domain-containing protein n=1 Tax=Rhynchosporium secalis TaxID=38038 RepID=A0A1E1M634_RHYSE|nr:uncharacterized protein RSE6_04763 [Rhynchosporium secalis]
MILLEKSFLYFCDGAEEEEAATTASSEPLRTSFKAYPPRKSNTSNIIQFPPLGGLPNVETSAEPINNDIWNETATSVGSNGDFENIVDVILSPVGPSAAPKIDTAKWSGYSSQWILSDYPALVLPVDKVDADKDGEKVIYKPRDEKDLYNWSLWERYGSEGYKDAPNSVQLIGRRYEDERVIQALEIV